VCNFSTALPEKKLKKKKKYVKNNKENNVIFKSTARTSQNIEQTEYSMFSLFFLAHVVIRTAGPLSGFIDD